MRKNQKGFAVFFLPLIVGGIFIVGYLLFNQNAKTLNLIEKPSEEYPVDTENDGVYRDYKYNFTFTYPKNIFIHQYPGPSWYNEEFGELPPTATNKSALGLRVIVRDTTSSGTTDADGSNYKESYINKFNEFLNVNINQKVTWGARKLSEQDYGNYKSVTFFYMTPSDKESEYTGAYYSTWFLKNNYPVIEITVDANNEEALKKYKPIFDHIVTSFKFVE